MSRYAGFHPHYAVLQFGTTHREGAGWDPNRQLGLWIGDRRGDEYGGDNAVKPRARGRALAVSSHKLGLVDSVRFVKVCHTIVGEKLVAYCTR